MLLWILIAFLTTAAILAVLLPLARTPAAADPVEHARGVYLDQLKELERDKAEGRMNATEAEAARAEVARRLLVLEREREGAAPAGGNLMARRAVSVAALVGIPLLSLSLYLSAGKPKMPGMPLAARQQELTQTAATAQTPSDVDALVTRVERHLAENPEDGAGWEVVAPVYMRLDRPDDAARAWRNVIRLLGSNADRQMSLGEALWMSGQGVINAEARAAFEAANTLSPDAPGPRFFLALAAEQEGNIDEAKKRMKALLADAPPDAPWRDLVAQGVAGLEKGGTAMPETAMPGTATPGPTAADVANAQNMAPEEQVAMIEGMVKNLSARLKDNPDDPDGWLMLMRSNVVLGRPDAAKEAATAALKVVTDPKRRGEIEAALAQLNGAPAPPGAATDTAMAMANNPPPVPPHPTVGPSADDIAAAGKLSPDERSQMADSMVDRLAARLKESPDDVQGWLMLIRSYAVLGDPAKAEQAARDAFKGVKDPRQHRLIEEALAGLNLGGATPGQPSAPAAPPPMAAQQPGPSAADVAAAQQMTPEDRNAMIEGMVGRLAARLKDSPDDVEGWLRLIRAYAVLGKADEAAQARRDALAGVGDPAGRQRIEALVAELGGGQPSAPTAPPMAAQQPGPTAADVAAAQQMTPEDRNTMIEGMVARLAGRLKDSPDDAEGWLRLIRAYAVLGKADEAAQAGRDALAGVSDPAGRQRISALISELGGGQPSAPPAPPMAAQQPGPTAADVAAAQQMAPEDRSAMIEGMVGRLAARLKDSPDDVEGWLRLIRSYSVLGKADQAAEAARDALAGVSDPGGRQRVQALIADLGVTPKGASQ